MTATDCPQDDAAIEALFDQFLEGWNAGSGPAFAAPFTPEVDFIGFDGIHLTSRQEIESVHQELFDKWLKGTRLVGRPRIRRLTNDVAVVIATGDTIMRGKHTPARERRSIQTLTAVCTADGWRFASFQNTRVRHIGTGARSALLWLVTDQLWKWFGPRHGTGSAAAHRTPAGT